MAKVLRTNHTVLVNITSHKSHGAGDIISGHLATTEKYISLSSLIFKKYPLYSLVVVKIKLSGKRRLIQWVRMDEDVRNTVEFKEIYNEILEKENKEYDRVHGKFRREELPTIKTGETIEAREGKSFEPKPFTIKEKTESTEPVEKIDWSEKIYITPQDEKVLATLEKLSNKKHISVMMIGPSGYGKTSIPQQKAQDWNMEFLRWDCATVRDPEEFFGFRGAVDGSTMTEDGETFFAESEFTKVIEAGNAIIVLDELNRIDPYISNILFPLLDHAGKTSVAGHEVKVGPNVIFFATVNLGFQFTGTFTLDTALTNRFAAKILVNALPSDIESNILVSRAGVETAQANRIVRLMQGLRSLNKKDQLSIDASTRVSIQIAELVGCGLDLKSALVYVVINGISDEEAKLVIDQLGIIS